MAEQIIGHLGYVGIALILILGGLGLPIPEEAPVILAAVLSKSGKMLAPLALATCLVGVLLGDFIVYFLGYYYGEKVLSLRFTRRLLTRAREAQIKGYFHRHGFKILILGRFAVGFRTAAYLTAGILQLPPLKLFLTDLLAASISTFLMFGLGYLFAQQIQSGIREAQQYLTVALVLGVILFLLYRFYRGHQRAGLPVGPPVLFGEEPPLPPDDLKMHSNPRPERTPPADPVPSLNSPKAPEPRSSPSNPAMPLLSTVPEPAVAEEPQRLPPTPQTPPEEITTASPRPAAGLDSRRPVPVHPESTVAAGRRARNVE